MNIDVTEFGKNLLLAFMERVDDPEVVFQLLVGIDRQIHLPDAHVVREEGVNGREPLDFRRQRRTGDAQGATLRSACRAQPVGIHFRKPRHDLGELSGIEEDLAEGQFFRSIIQATDNVAFEGGAA